jgi:UDP-GlcNAc:undecaprenyl-phosphate GlcNAc-1-phosphate transferase
MTVPTPPWLAAAGAFAVTVAAILVLRRLALRIGLVDHPGGRKLHAGPVPLVGGLGMVLGLAAGYAASGSAAADLPPYLDSVLLLAVVGALDDRFGLSPGLRLSAQVVAVLPMFFGVGVRILTFGDLVGIGPLNVGPASFAATVFVTVAAINAFNLVDGLDGVAGGVALAALLVFLSLGPSTSAPSSAALATVLVACIAAFLLFNAPLPWDNSRYKCFMGDAGSTMLGFSLAWLLIRSSQGPAALLAPVTALWIAFVPAVDLLWTVLRRGLRRQSILRADGEHLHHLLQQAGLGPRAAAAAMVGGTLLAGYTGVGLERTGVPAWESFAAWWVAGTGLMGAATLVARRR